MATYSTGITVTFGSVTFTGVQGLDWSYGQGLPRGRDTSQSGAAFSDDLGTVSLACLGAAGIATTQYGKREQLTITGGGADLTCKAVCTGISVTPQLNDVTRYGVTFQILDN